MANTPYNTLGYGGAQVLPENPYSPLTRMLQMGISPATGMTVKEAERLAKDRRDFKLEDVQAWEDVKGHEEISQDMDTLRSVWNEAYARGMNISNPKNKHELALQKAFNAKMDQVKRKSDLYATQGERYASIQGIMDKEKDRIDVEGTQANLAEWMKKDPFERAKSFDQLVKYKAKPVDVVEHTMTSLGSMVDPEQKFFEPRYDEATGKVIVESLKTIPEDKRISALRQIWQFGDQVEGFKEAVAQAAAEDVTFNADPEAPDYDAKLGEWYVDQFRDAKSGETKTARLYSVGEGGDLKISFGSGIPEKDPESGLYAEESDTVHTHNKWAGGVTEHTSPTVVNLQGEEMYGTNTPSKALQVDITDDFINTQTGEPEAEGGVYSFLPTKIVWMNVLEEDIKGGGLGFMWPMRPKYKKGQVLSDDQLQEVKDLNKDMEGSGEMYRYHKVPYVMGRLAYKQVEVQGQSYRNPTNIESFNRTSMVPYEVIEKDIRAHKGKKWRPYESSIWEITRQLNSGWQIPNAGIKSPLDY